MNCPTGEVDIFVSMKADKEDQLARYQNGELKSVTKGHEKKKIR